MGIPVESAKASRKTPPGPHDTSVGINLSWMNFRSRDFAPYQVYCKPPVAPGWHRRGLRPAPLGVPQRIQNPMARIDYN
jgi:hypothetical protein